MSFIESGYYICFTVAICFSDDEPDVVRSEECSRVEVTESERPLLPVQLKERLKKRRMLFSKNDIELSITFGQGLCVPCVLLPEWRTYTDGGFTFT